MRLLPKTGNDAEDAMAVVPLLFCALPLAIAALVIIVGVVAWAL